MLGRTDLTAATAALAPAFAVAERSYGPEPRSERHAHVQVVLPLVGALDLSVGGFADRVHGSVWVVVAPGREHAFRAKGANRFLVADFAPRLAGAERVAAAPPFRRLDRRAEALLPLLRLEAASGGLAEPVVAEALGRYAAIALGLPPPEDRSPTTRIGAIDSDGRANPIAARLRDYVDAAWAEPVTLGDAAAVACCSPAHATRCFRAAFGIGPIAYLQRVRIGHARRLLETTDLSAGEVAARVGFASQPWFTRLFAREVGLPPAAYRAALRRESGKSGFRSGKT